MHSTVFQSWLDHVGDLVFAGAFEAYLDLVDLPLTFRTESAVIEVRDPETMRSRFEAWCHMLASQNATQMIRTAHDVALHPDGSISGQYSTEILSRATRVVPPFQSRMTLVHRDGGWKAKSISNNLTNPGWPVQLPRVSAARPVLEGRADGAATPIAEAPDLRAYLEAQGRLARLAPHANE